MHPDVARASAAEAHEARLAVPPEQHPGVEVARGVERQGLHPQQAVGDPDAGLDRVAADVLARDRHAPLAVGEPAGVQPLDDAR